MKNPIKEPNSGQFFILDIDSTLVTTHQRNQAIINEFIKNFSRTYPDDCQQLERLRCQLGDYGYYSALKRVGFAEQHSGSLEKLNQFWREHFFSNDYLSYDQPTPNAVNWVKMLKSQNIEFIYLTARHSDKMWDGTLSTMKKMGFPISADILFLKEKLEESDETYKSNLLQPIVEKNINKELWLIDNEPVVLHRILTDHPQVKTIWFHSTHSGKMAPPESSIEINTF